MKRLTALSLGILLTFQISAKINPRVPNTLEVIPDDENTTIQTLLDKLRDLNKTEWRQQHPKPHACIDGASLTVDFKDADYKLPNGEVRRLEAGVFLKGAKYDVQIRTSSGSNQRNASDTDGGVVGFGMKLKLQKNLRDKLVAFNGDPFKVKYADALEKLRELFFLKAEDYYQTYDLITIAGGTDEAPVKEFFADTAKDYIDFFEFNKQVEPAVKAIIVKAIADGKNPKTDPEVKKAIGAKVQELMLKLYILADPKNPRKAAGAVLARLAQTTVTDLFIKEYNSFLPSLHGKDANGKDQAVKFMLRPSVPVDPKTVKKPDSVDITKDDFRTDWAKHHLRTQETKFDLLVQFHVGSDKTFPGVDVGTAVWPEKVSPYVKIATLTIPRKNEGSELMDATICETSSYNPVHALPENMGIGASNRVRGPVYVDDSNLRNLKAGRKPLN